VQGSKQIGHSDTSSKKFLRDAWTEDNVNSIMRRIEDDTVVMECVLLIG